MFTDGQVRTKTKIIFDHIVFIKFNENPINRELNDLFKFNTQKNLFN